MSDEPDHRAGDTSSATHPPQALVPLGSQREQQTLGDAGAPPASDAPAPPRPSLGTRLGKYVLLEPIGRGAMGIVYKAWHEELAKTVALKVMSRPDLEGSLSAFERFQTEARAAARLSHPNIVSVLDAGVADGWHYFTMELVEGETLQTRLERGCLDPMEAARIGEGLAQALAHAHANGVIHRDVKPQNILLTTDAGAKLADFGLAKDVRAGHGPTLVGQILGTPNYMSPEQAGGQLGEIDGRSDIFSLGAVLYECVTGHVPFNGSNVAEIIDQIRARDPKPMRFHSAVLSPEFEAIVFQCMEKDKRARYAKAEDLVEDLQRFRRGEMVVARRQTLFYRLRRRARKNWRMAAFVVVVIGLAAGAIALRERSASRSEAVVARKDEIIQLVKQAEQLSREREVASVRNAIAACDRALEGPSADGMRSTLAQAAFLRGIAHRRLLSIDLARYDLELAFELDPSRNDARYELAIIDFEAGEVKAAEELLGAVAKGTAKGSVLHLMAKARLAQIRSRKRETSPQQAADCHAEIDHDLDEVEKKDPLFADQYFFRASLLGFWAGYAGGMPQPPLRKPDLGMAVKQLEQGLMLEPLSMPARLSRGDDLRRLERYQEAMRDFEAARELAPEDVRVYYLHARTASALRLYDFALSDLQQALRIRESDEFLVYRGLVRICLGDTKAALEDAEKAYALRSSKPENVFFLAVCLSLAGDDRRSKELARSWRKANSPFFQQVARVDAEMLANPAIASLFTSMLKDVNRGVDDYFGVQPVVKKMTYTFMRGLVSRKATEHTTYGLREAMDQLGKPNDLMPPEIEDMLLRADEKDPRQQEMLRATNMVLESVDIRTPLQTLLQITRFTIMYYDLLALTDRPSVTDPQELYRRGCFRFYKGERDDLLAARTDFRKALEMRPSFPEALYGLAVTAGHLAFEDEAIDALRRLKRTGFAGWDGVAEDPDLSSVKDSPEFKRLVKD